MVFLGACIFSTMMNFQTLLAQEKMLNFSYFYFFYTCAVLVVRFILMKYLVRINPKYLINALLGLMTLSMILFSMLSSNIYYAVASFILGLAYGAVYPLIQAKSVEQANSQETTNNLTLFSLSYFVGVYGFPVLFTQLFSINLTVACYCLVGISLLELACGMKLEHR
jgi:MFS family permease